MKTHRYFPLFIDTEGVRALVIGGGSVASRRVQTLSRFGFRITVIAEQICDEIRAAEEGGRIECIEEALTPETAMELLENYRTASPIHSLILACTNDRELNESIGKICREHGIPVNVCDAREESTFWFPAIALNEELTMGLVGDGRSHGTVRDAAAALREIIEERNY